MRILQIEEWIPITKKVAKFTVADFPDLEQEDMEQSLIVFVMEHETKFEKMDPDKSWSALVWVAQRLAWKERREHLILTPQYNYRTADVRKILETIFDYGDWDKTFVPDDARSNQGNDHLDLAGDVKWAYERLNDAQRQILFRRYADQDQESFTSTESAQLSRAHARLAEILNSYDRAKPEDGPGTRRAQSNNAALHNISRLYEEYR